MDVLQNQQVAIVELCHAYSIEKLFACGSVIVTTTEWEKAMWICLSNLLRLGDTLNFMELSSV